VPDVLSGTPSRQLTENGCPGARVLRSLNQPLVSARHTFLSVRRDNWRCRQRWHLSSKRRPRPPQCCTV
jgi:hypothetical protein